MKNKIDKARERFLSELIDNQKKDFERLESTERLLDLKSVLDGNFLMENFTKWYGNSKNKDQKKIIFDCINSLMRLNSYIDTLKTVSKMSVIELNTEKKRNQQLLRKVNEMTYEIKMLKDGL